MDLSKIVRIVALLVAVVAGLVAIPQEGVIIAVLGLVAGWFIPEDRRVPVMIMTLTLALVHGALAPLPVVGSYLTDILASVSSLLNAGAIMVICMQIYDRLK